MRLLRWVLVALLVWWTVGFARHPVDGAHVAESFLHLVNLPFHEAGHVLFAPFGRFLTALGGSLLQVLIPLICAGAFWRQHDLFAVSVCAWWAGQNLADLAPYIADARALQLPLLGGRTGAEVEGHDWEAILQSLGLLQYDRALGRVAHLGGVLVMFASAAGAAWVAGRGPDQPDASTSARL
jgi:hypothetical protein